MRTPKPILDRRRSVRIHEELPFKIGHENYEVEARTLNISEHGALCLVEKNVPLMTQLAVALTLPPLDKKKKRGKTLRIKAVVVRREKDVSSDKYFLAIYFSQISPEDRETLIRFIECRLTRRD
jgi:c-di-GMP-binding flagellar brake protein YcgR